MKPGDLVSIKYTLRLYEDPIKGVVSMPLIEDEMIEAAIKVSCF